MLVESRFEDAVSVSYKGFSVIPSILLATRPIWKDNVRNFVTITDRICLITQVYQQSFCCGKNVEGKK